jgi:hypothetical protein
MGLFSTYQSTSLPLLSTLYEPPPKHLISVLGVRQSPTRPARLLALLRQEHFTVLSVAHYQAIRVALAHNTFQDG